MFLTIPSDRINSIFNLIEQIPDWKNLDAIFIGNLDILKASPSKTNIDITGISKDSTLSCSLKQIKFDMWAVDWIELNGFRKTYSSSPLGNSIYISYKEEVA